MAKEDRDNDTVNKFSHTMHNSVSELIQKTIVAAQREDHISIAGATLLTGHATIAGLELMAMMVAKKPKVTQQEVEDIGSQLAVNLISPETMMFGALLVAKMHQGSHPLDGSKSLLNTEFGPSVFLEAIDAFEKVMGFKPDKYLDPGLVSAARDLEKGSEAPLAAFMAKRQESKDTPLN